MSRSRKVPILKDRPRGNKKSSVYWRTVRRVINERVRFYYESLDDEELPQPEEIINDYDYCDYIWDGRFPSVNDTDTHKDWAKRLGRK